MKLLEYFASFGVLVLLLAKSATIFFNGGWWYSTALFISFLSFFFYVWYQCYKRNLGEEYGGKGGGKSLVLACFVPLVLMLFVGVLFISNILGRYV